MGLLDRELAAIRQGSQLSRPLLAEQVPITQRATAQAPRGFNFPAGPPPIQEGSGRAQVRDLWQARQIRNLTGGQLDLGTIGRLQRGETLAQIQGGNGNAGSGSRGGSGSSGGGGGGGVNTGEADEVQARLAQLRAERLEAALSAIGASFDLTEGELNARRRDLATQFDTGIAANDRLFRDVTTEAENNAADRGLGRSGIFAQNLAEGTGRVADERASLVGALNTEEGAEGTQVRDIMSAILLLAQQEEAAVAEAELDAESEELTTELMRILAESGLG